MAEMAGPEKAAAAAGRGTGRVKEDRLSRGDWLEAGMAILARSGPGGLRIAQVCEVVEASKGSFYWHFRDRRDFLVGLFGHWRQRETSALIARTEAAHDSPRDRLWHVIQFVTLGSYDVGCEVAMRQWGQGDPDVRDALAEVDAERLEFFARQFRDSGFAPEEARLRALSVYSLTLSCGYMLTGETPAELEARLRTSLDMLLARRD
ncbi:TetR/AcrR family transcriptional regulator [Mangrovicoccus ximenensis]|uniref:TetR/AcrR family transcriptional regulator n=1 Tax=Mangrovicoccus ximenensis TaxID=1911570 RepID=UPI001374A83A|nr:TetR/AcrR family transcriptional regulator [Mangrovicoccus ximenensis]